MNETKKSIILNRLATIISGVGEVLYWIASVFTLALTILSAIGRFEWFKYLTDIIAGEANELSQFGFSIAYANGAALDKWAFFFFFLAALFESLGMAMIFRNVNLIMKTTQGKTSFAKGVTPFQPDNIRMVREIGIFFIAIAVIEFIITVIAGIVLTPELETSTNAIFVVIGIIILCLSQFFDYGMKLQNDVDGLL